MKLSPFKPRLLADLKGYTTARLGRDLVAGATVGIVALPLAMAFAIASGLSPEAGLWTAIVAGFLVAALGGSSVQISGPAGAFIVIVAGIVAQHGLAGLLIATFCSGVLLFLLGGLGLGNLVRLVPVSVIVGFTNGIAVLIALSQLRDWLGLQLEAVPVDFFHQMEALWAARSTFNPYAFALGLACVAGLWLWPRLFAMDSRFRAQLAKLDTVSALKATSKIPGPVVALVTLSAVAYALHWPVETIGSRFGSIHNNLPSIVWPDLTWASIKQLVAPTLTLAVLGALSSLLCARVADQLSGLPKHDPNQELMAQGISNMLVPLIGGMPTTGAIARTVTNVRAGATSPVAGMVHSLILAVIVLLAAPLALHIPLAVLAGILLFVAWNMGEWSHFAKLSHYSSHYRLVFLSTFVLTVVFDLTVAMEVGVGLACLMFVKRMSALFQIEPIANPDAKGPSGTSSTQATYRIHGSLFFGAAPKMDTLLDLVNAAPNGFSLVLDLQNLVALDTTGLEVLEQLQQTLHRKQGVLYLQKVPAQAYSLLERTGFVRLEAVRCDCLASELD